MEYQRLTTTKKSGVPRYICTSIDKYKKYCHLYDDCHDCPFYTQVLIQLAELEDKIENGALVELNDKLIGESVYGVQQDTNGRYWFDGDENTLLGFTSCGIVTWNDSHGYNDWFKNGFWFLTREEAEAKLKELQE